MKFKFDSLPIDGPLRITSHFGKRHTGIAGASVYHDGVDIGRDWDKPETAVLAVKEGTVQGNYWNDYRGWVVVLRHDETYSTLYQHLKYKSNLKKGDRVKAGQSLGIMGASSNPAVLKVAVHLHFELRDRGTPIDPEPSLYEIAEEEIDMTRDELEKLIDQRLEAKLRGDGTTVSNWAKESWEISKEEGIVDGTRPGGYTTREQVQQMIQNFRRAMGKKFES